MDYRINYISKATRGLKPEAWLRGEIYRIVYEKIIVYGSTISYNGKDKQK